MPRRNRPARSRRKPLRLPEFDPRPERVSTEAMARDLVRRNLASPRILQDDGRLPHPSQKADD